MMRHQSLYSSLPSSKTSLPPPLLILPMRSQIKLYEHPEFVVDEKDISLLSTICFVLALAISGAFFILMMSCILFWDDCRTSYVFYSRKPQLVTVQQLLRG
ncbi:hypothetical protein B0H21DRAFT_718705 [Amylocystis lapponica]|nr:hypothetical protein B0H21DRAFT_718705 [Amylocystis lapponica]